MHYPREHIYICADYPWQCARRSNIYLHPIWHCGIENATFDIPYLCSQKKRWWWCWGGGYRCMINCCPDKSSREMVEDDADDRSIMPQRRLEKPTIERRSCHSILQNAPHQRVSLCHSSRQDEITHSDIFHPSLKLCQCFVQYVTLHLKKKFTQSRVLWLICLAGSYWFTLSDTVSKHRGRVCGQMEMKYQLLDICVILTLITFTHMKSVTECVTHSIFHIVLVNMWLTHP